MQWVGHSLATAPEAFGVDIGVETNNPTNPPTSEIGRCDVNSAGNAGLAPSER